MRMSEKTADEDARVAAAIHRLERAAHDYTPTLDRIRAMYVHDRADGETLSEAQAGSEFDRALAKHDAETLRTVAVEVYALHEEMQARADLWEGGR